MAHEKHPWVQTTYKMIDFLDQTLLDFHTISFIEPYGQHNFKQFHYCEP